AVTHLCFYSCVAPRHLHSFPTRRSSDLPVESAVTDIEMIESLAPQPDLGMNLYAPQSEPGILHFKIYRRGSRVPLSDSLPMLERSEEHTSELQSLAYLVCRLLLEKKKTN